MTMNSKFRMRQVIIPFALAFCILTVVPVAVRSFTVSPASSPGTASPGGITVIHKNSVTPYWLARALDRADRGVWI